MEYLVMENNQQVKVEYWANGNKKKEGVEVLDLVEKDNKVSLDFNDGLKEEWYENGVLKSKIISKNLFWDLVEYWDNGEVKTIGKLASLIPYGTFRQFFKNGNPKSLEHYAHWDCAPINPYQYHKKKKHKNGYSNHPINGIAIYWNKDGRILDLNCYNYHWDWNPKTQIKMEESLLEEYKRLKTQYFNQSY
jgi:antitoxin component YwqK of YwqJK toxin-antitoxin module